MTQKIEVDINELRQITSWLAAVDIEFIEIRKPGATVRLTLGTASCTQGASAPATTGTPSVRQEPVAAQDSAQTQTVDVTAKSAGIFLTTHPARSAPLVSAGAQVRQGDIVGLLQVAQLCLPVVAPVDGVVTSLLAGHGAAVGYGKPLLVLSPAA